MILQKKNRHHGAPRTFDFRQSPIVTVSRNSCNQKLHNKKSVEFLSAFLPFYGVALS